MRKAKGKRDNFTIAGVDNNTNFGTLLIFNLLTHPTLKQGENEISVVHILVCGHLSKLRVLVDYFSPYLFCMKEYTPP